jgi:hypothetical protein
MRIKLMKLTAAGFSHAGSLRPIEVMLGPSAAAA